MTETKSILAACIDRLREYDKAMDEGRMIILPMKPGDPVYEVMSRRIVEREFLRVDPGLWIQRGAFPCRADHKALGVEYFLTREEAQAELLRRNKGGTK